MIGVVSKMEAQSKYITVESVLTENVIKGIVQKAALDDWKVLGYDVNRASKGLSGFLGDHFRVVLHLQKGDFTKKMHLFAKFMPMMNKPKAEFINNSNFFRRENLMYTLFEDMGVASEPTSWCPIALIHTDNLVVMPDLSVAGYKSLFHQDCLDLKHVLVVVTSVARYHSRFACYEARRDIERQQQNSIYEDHKEMLEEMCFRDSPWLRAAAKLTFNLLQEFSTTIEKNIENLEETLSKMFIRACHEIEPNKDNINVLIHRDLWMNNIFFRYEDNEPTEAVLLDFQCVRYAPPAFDIMIFLYLTTSREFRKAHEKEVFNHYYTVFTQYLDDTVKSKLKDYNYGRWDFFNWCERARMFAMTETIGIFPYILMEPSYAQKVFDNPDTYMKLLDEDRSEPVLAYARECTAYRERQLEVSEEFVERYVLKRL